MRHRSVYATVALTVLLAAGCATSPARERAANDPAAGPAVTHLDLSASGDNPTPPGAVGAGERPPDVADQPDTPPTADASPEAAAAAWVIELLEAEGLYVLDIATAVTQRQPGLAVVAVSVLHGTGRAHPHDSHYRITLTDDGGGWQPAALETAP